VSGWKNHTEISGIPLLGLVSRIIIRVATVKHKAEDIGSRLPFYIISPWTRGAQVFTEHADHTSQILFLEQFLQANGYDFVDEQISDWRRAHMSNLVNGFDFDNASQPLSYFPPS
jgi:phospholipase C